MTFKRTSLNLLGNFLYIYNVFWLYNTPSTRLLNTYIMLSLITFYIDLE